MLRPASKRECVLAEWARDPGAPVSDIARRAGCTQGYASKVTLEAGRQPAFRPIRRRETPLQRRMRWRQYWRDRRAAKREATHG